MSPWKPKVSEATTRNHTSEEEEEVGLGSHKCRQPHDYTYGWSAPYTHPKMNPRSRGRSQHTYIALEANPSPIGAEGRLKKKGMESDLPGAVAKENRLKNSMKRYGYTPRPSESLGPPPKISHLANFTWPQSPDSPEIGAPPSPPTRVYTPAAGYVCRWAGG